MELPDDIPSCRDNIDRLDDEILRILNERSQYVIQVGHLKKKKDATAHLHTQGRETAIFERLASKNPGPFPSSAIRPVYREIMSASLSLEGSQTVAYLGPPATFTHLAAVNKFGESAKYIPVSSIKDVFDEVERGRIRFGIVPVENSTEGVVNHTLDLLVDSPLLIYGEIRFEIGHNVLSKADSLEQIKTIYSHPQAIAQCRKWLEVNLPTATISEEPSTARAAERCVDDPTAGAIASELAAELYQLKILRSRIEDNIHNATRFLILSQRGSERTGKDKTSIIVSAKDRVGALYDMIRPFSSYGINMTKIESRPTRRKVWEYLFFMDLEGHQDDDRVKKAIDEVKGRCLFLKVLGSYPSASS